LVGCPQFQADEFEKTRGEGGSGAGGSAGNSNTADPVNISITSGGGSSGSGAGNTATTAASSGGSDATSTGGQSETDSASATDGGGSGGSGGTDATSKCNNGVIDLDEECDGAELGGATCESEGRDGGQLSCADDCTFDISRCTCGDGEAQAHEQCDGTDLANESCEMRGFAQGELVCNGKCQFDQSGCSACFTASAPTGVVFSGDTSEHESRVDVHSSSCTDGGEGPDVSFTWTAPTTDCYLISVSSSNDTILSVYEDCSLATELECDDTGGYGQGSQIYLQQATANTEYTVVVDSFSSADAGPVTVEITSCGSDWGSTGGRP
jgi:hypothetical protein